MYENKASVMGAFAMSPLHTDNHILQYGETPSLGYCSLKRNCYSHEEHLLAQMLFLYHINHNQERIRKIKIISRNCKNFITHSFSK